MYRPALPTLPTSTGTTVPSTPRSDVQNIWQTLNSSGICNLASFRTQRLGLLWIRGCTLTWVHSTRYANHFHFLETFYDHCSLLGCWWHHVSYHVWRSGPRWDQLNQLYWWNLPLMVCFRWQGEGQVEGGPWLGWWFCQGDQPAHNKLACLINTVYYLLTSRMTSLLPEETRSPWLTSAFSPPTQPSRYDPN